MAKKTTPAQTDQPAEPALRTCIGSTRYDIEAHDAPVHEFPVQPSQRDGLGRMCRTHWNAYTAGLARDAKVRKSAAGQPVAVEVTPTSTAVPTMVATSRVVTRKTRPADADAAPSTAIKAEASVPDFKAAAEADEVLVERGSRVRAWRQVELTNGASA